jgi:hypothetical protein
VFPYTLSTGNIERQTSTQETSMQETVTKPSLLN